jgi:hypothetical protein
MRSRRSAVRNGGATCPLSRSPIRATHVIGGERTERTAPSRFSPVVSSRSGRAGRGHRADSARAASGNETRSLGLGTDATVDEWRWRNQMRYHHTWPALVGGVAAVFVACAAGAVQAQAAGERVHNAAAGISIVPPAGWHQLVPRPGGAASDSRSGSAAERQAFLEQLADSPQTMLFLFAKDVQFQDSMQTPSILVRVMRSAPLGPRPVDSVIAAIEGQADPRLSGPVRRTDVSGRPLPMPSCATRQPSAVRPSGWWRTATSCRSAAWCSSSI